MKREQLEHLVRAAGDVLGEDAVIVAGSQAALAQFPEGLPRLATLSREADLLALDDPDDTKALRINGAIGEDTQFDATYGYYAEGVGRELLVLPRDWEERAVHIVAHGQKDVTGIVPEIHDLAVAKIAAGRDKDFQWARALIQSGHLRPEILLERAAQAPLQPHQRRFIMAVAEGAQSPGRRSRRNLRRLRALLEQPDDLERPT
ncbi:MAG: DUF6036 family nucleotidyltransferase [Acidobacteriaceae bacterium]